MGEDLESRDMIRPVVRTLIQNQHHTFHSTGKPCTGLEIYDKNMGRRPCELVLIKRLFKASTSHFSQAVVTKSRRGMVIASENNERGKEATKNSFAEDMQTLKIQYAYSNSCWKTCSRLSFLYFFLQTTNRQDARSQRQGKRAPAIISHDHQSTDSTPFKYRTGSRVQRTFGYI
ncbi:hypothetical protein D5086_025731 [Populus alba]|uniref:Uncharacterized protein n=1 Tax=Populus alba TaxID=43335 RepID=A0ACC4AZX3_POPAL